MSDSEFMMVGIFFLSMFGYALITGLLGVLMTLGEEESLPGVAWIVGGLLYAITVMIMWQG